MEQEPSKRLMSRNLSSSPLDAAGFLPPQATDLEEGVIGVAMLERNAAQVVIEKLVPDDFYKEDHRCIFEAILSLAEEGHAIDQRSVVAMLRKKLTIDLAGGAFRVAEIVMNVHSAASVEYHCTVIKEMSIKRKLILLGSMLVSRGYQPDQDVFALMDELRKQLMEIEGVTSGKHKEVHIQDGLFKLVKELQDRALVETKQLTGVPSGFWAIDRITQGWQNSDLIIIAGRPGMAKTSLAWCMARNAAVDFKVPIAFFSLEMSTKQLVAKVASMETEIDLKIIRGEKFTDLEWMQFNNKIGKLSNAPLYIDDTPSLSILELRSRCRRLKDQYKIGMIIVDYLQLLRGDRASRGNREEEIASISRTLKQIAKELDIPVIALSQLSRQVEQRGGKKKPQLSDLRESGAIEQDADIVGFIWRPEYYKIEVDEDGTPYIPGLTELNFAKHRNGAQGTAELQFIGKLTSFRTIIKGDAPSIASSGMSNVPPPPDEPPAATAYPDNSDLPF